MNISSRCVPRSCRGRPGIFRPPGPKFPWLLTSKLKWGPANPETTIGIVQWGIALARFKIGARGLSEISRIYGTVRLGNVFSLVRTVGTVGTVCWYA